MSDPNAAPNAAPAAPNTAPNAAPAAPPANAAPAAPPANAAPPADPNAPKAWWDNGKITEPEIVEFAKAKNYQSPEEALRAAWSANKMNKLEPYVQAVMDGKATPEQEAAFYNKLGRPEAADKYDLKAPEGVQADEGLTKLGKEIFFELGATPKKAEAMFAKWNKFVAESNAKVFETERAANEAGLKALETKWGAQLEQHKAAGNRVVKSLGLANETITAIEKNIGSAAIVELLALIGSKTAEGTLKGGSETTDPENIDGMTPAQIDGKIAEIQASTAYTDKKHPLHADTVKKMERLFAKQTPGKK